MRATEARHGGCIAVLNAGSSSIKFALYEAGERPARCCSAARSSGIGTAPRFDGDDAAGETVGRAPLDRRRRSSITRRDRATSLTLGARAAGRPTGARRSATASCTAACDFDAPVRDRRRGAGRSSSTLVPLAPLHQPHNLAPIRGDRRGARRTCRRSPASTPPSIAASRRWRRSSPCRATSPTAGVRRYGFHGLSYEYIASRLAEIDPDAGAGRAGRRPPRQRRQPVRRRATGAASPAPWASPPSTG